MICERCGSVADRLYEVGRELEAEYDDKIIIRNVCWSCDHDVINGGDLFLESGEILADREENDYEYDPINNPRPY